MSSYARGTPASQIMTPQQEIQNMRDRMAAAGFPPKGSMPPPVTGAGGAGLGKTPMPGVTMVRPGPGGPNAATDRGMGRGMGRHGKGLPKTGGLNPGMRQPLPMPPSGSAIRSMAPMAAQQIMPTGRAFAKGGMVGCGWKAPSSKTMRGAARKGK